MLNNLELAKLLRENGCKVTPQRLAIYDVLAHTKDHPTAEEIYKKIRLIYPTMSFATVYKSVEVLNKVKAVQVLNTGEPSFRYDADVTPHAHIQCTACGKVRDVKMDEKKDLEIAVARESGYEVTGSQAYFYGICPNCQEKH